ncbi:MAG: SH3 domain-containing protein [Paracoccaceae bacterium]
MFRLLFLLLAGIGLAMFFADSFPQPEKLPQKITALEEKVAPLKTAVAAKPTVQPKVRETVAIATALEPKAVATPTPESPKTDIEVVAVDIDPPSYLDLFQAPVVVGSDGKLEIAIQKTETDAIENTILLAAVENQPEDIPNVWFVTGERVNVRQGPTTSAAVVDQVVFAEAVEVLTEPDNGWVMIRIEGDGVEGYMANRFLQSNDPQG